MQSRWTSVGVVLVGLLVAGALGMSWSAQAQSSPRAKIAFVSDRDGDDDDEIYIMDADGANPRNLTDHRSNDKAPAFFHPAGLAVSRTGKRALTWGWIKESGSGLE